MLEREASSGDKKRRTLKHVAILVTIVLALVLMGHFSWRLPKAEWTGPIVVTILFLYGAWILLALGPRPRE